MNKNEWSTGYTEFSADILTIQSRNLRQIGRVRLKGFGWFWSVIATFDGCAMIAQSGKTPRFFRRKTRKFFS